MYVPVLRYRSTGVVLLKTKSRLFLFLVNFRYGGMVGPGMLSWALLCKCSVRPVKKLL